MIHTAYKHGGDVFGAARSLHCSPREIYDFSANINPLGPSPLALEAIQDNLDLIRHYPDPHCTELRTALSGYLKIEPERILLGNGVAELIYLLARVMGFRRAVVTAPSFGEYAAAVSAAGGEVSEVPLLAEEGFKLNVTRIKKALRGADVVFIGNPNNPTGRTVKPRIIQSIIDEARSHGVTIVVDEAFIDFVHQQEQYTVLPMLADYSNLIVLYSLTKFFAIPGLRLGALLAVEPIIEQLTAAKEPWNVNTLAQIGGTAALADEDYQDRSRQMVWQERDSLHQAISLIPGLQAYSSEANFLLIEMANAQLTSTQLAAQSAQQGVLVRDCAGFSGLSERYFRVAVRSREENAVLLKVLREIMKGAEHG